jgi:Insertion element 4 transposase N-terminal/Transposase DDE domain
MPRAGQTKPPVTPRLPDRIAIGVLTQTFPPELVDRVIAKCGRAEQRQRLLPARVVVYYTLAMCLFAQVGYEEVMRLLVEGLAWARRWRGSWQVPDKSSIARARARLGPAPLRELFVQVARPLATQATPGAWYRGWRLLALDGTTLDVPDTPTNLAAFGRPGGGRGQGAFPQVRLVGLVECGTHVIVDAAMGGLHLGEGSLAPSLARSLGPGMLLLVDQGLCGLALWRTLQATGAELVWRCRADVKLEVLEVFADGSWRSELGAGHPKSKRAAVRVVDYHLDDPGRPSQPEGYRLITTILDPERAPAVELPALYPQRWEMETALDELKTHQRGPGVVLRSREPDGVRQEVWAHLLVHHAIRRLMHQAALQAEVDPDRLSFTRSLHIARRQVTSQAAFSCGVRKQVHAARRYSWRRPPSRSCRSTAPS